MSSGQDRMFLEAQVRRHKEPRSFSDWCRMVLLCAEGLQGKEVAERLGVHKHTVGKRRRRFVKDGIEGLLTHIVPAGSKQLTGPLCRSVLVTLAMSDASITPSPALRTTIALDSRGAEWRAWVTDNLAQGCDPIVMQQRMAEQGWSASLAETAILEQH